MSPRDRVMRAVTFDTPDRAPMRHNVTGAAVYRHGEALLEILGQYPDDFGTDTSFSALMEQREESGSNLEQDKEQVDEWGCVWKRRQRGLFGQVVRRPLQDWAALDTYQPPPVPEPSPELVAQKRRLLSERQKTYFTFGAATWIWERMQLLRGDVDLMMDLMDEDPHTEQLADLLFDHARRTFEPALLAGCDAVQIGDDWGNQAQLRINPSIWRSFFRPRYEELFRFIHDHGALVRFHSCGHVLEIIPDLIDIGVDILNIQTSCMPLDALAHVARGKVCLEVDVDRQYEMPFGRPEDVRRRTRACLDALGLPEGGIIWLTEIGPDVPLENVKALYEAYREFGG